MVLFYNPNQSVQNNGPADDSDEIIIDSGVVGEFDDEAEGDELSLIHISEPTRPY